MKSTVRKLLPFPFLLLVFTLVMGTGVSAAEKRKLPKMIKYYAPDDELYLTTRYKYNAKGDWTTCTVKYYDSEGKLESTDKSVRKLTYYSGTNRVKKEVCEENGGSYSYKYTYTGSGALKSSIYKKSDGTYEKTTYVSSGSRRKSSVTRDKSGKKIRASKYDKYDNVTSTTYYGEKKPRYSYKYTYKKGVMRKSVIKYPDGQTETTTYNSKGDMKKSVYKSKDSSYTYTYKYKYEGGYLKELISYYHNESTGKKEQSGREVYTWTGKKYPVGH